MILWYVSFFKLNKFIGMTLVNKTCGMYPEPCTSSGCLQQQLPGMGGGLPILPARPSKPGAWCTGKTIICSTPPEHPVPSSQICTISLHVLLWFLFLLRLYLFLEGKGGKETLMCGRLSHTPNWGPGLQPRHVPWLGIELATLWFTGWCSIHWATPARADFYF